MKHHHPDDTGFTSVSGERFDRSVVAAAALLHAAWRELSMRPDLTELADRVNSCYEALGVTRAESAGQLHCIGPAAVVAVVAERITWKQAMEGLSLLEHTETFVGEMGQQPEEDDPDAPAD